jgi:hypothetical protein
MKLGNHNDCSCHRAILAGRTARRRTEEEVEGIVERLSRSKHVLEGGVLHILQMSETTDVLGLTNCWPTGPNVTALLELYGLDAVYSPVEVSRLINVILERAAIAQDVVGFEVRDVVSSTGKPRFIYQAKELENAGANAHATLASGLCPQSIFLAPAGKVKAPFSFKGEVTEAFFRSGFTPETIIPFSVFGNIQVAHDPNCVCKALSALAIWDSAQTPLELHFSILLRMAEIDRSGGGDGDLKALPSFMIGSDFFRSLVANQAGPQSRYGSTVLETSARLVLGQPKHSVDPFTKGPRSSAKEQWCRSRDGMLAYRTHVTKSGDGSV